MKQYKNLNLRAIRDEIGLDFAHYTYKAGQCSCCYSPKDQASIHWKNRKIPNGEDYTYILFKNADNGSGHVTKNDKIKDHTFISYKFSSKKQKEQFCFKLMEQLDEDYVLQIPDSNDHCICIYLKNNIFFSNNDGKLIFSNNGGGKLITQKNGSVVEFEKI